MDPQSIAFTPRDDIWRWQTEMLRVQQVQADHAERLQRLERRQEEDARMKSVWGTSSPFPGVLSGTPQQAPLSQPPVDAFTGFDDQQTNLIGSLHLDADEEPRRIGATSRANSVRFDESANQGHWSHASRTSIDLIPRTGSGLSGAHPMIERTYSHKSDGRQSSAGHSVLSMASGRANSLGIDTTFGLSNASSTDLPGLAPGLFLLGSVPCIIRCWLTTKFKHDSLLYAAVCTGSYTSSISSHLVEQLGYSERVKECIGGVRRIKLDVYLPEAITHPASSRSGSPAPQLPFINVEFTVQETSQTCEQSKAIQVVIGSDVLRAHSADILFSSNRMTLFDDERTKVTIPLVRPEDERAFKTLLTTSSERSPKSVLAKDQAIQANGSFRERSPFAPSETVSAERDSSAPTGAGHDTGTTSSTFDFSHDSTAPASATSSSPHPELAAPSAKQQTDSGAAPSGAIGVTRSGSSPAIWGNWRRDSESKPAPGQLDWARASKGDTSTLSSYQRRDQGIKVLKPQKSSSRTASTTQAASVSTSSPMTTTSAAPQSRFFDDGRRRSMSSESRPGAGTGSSGTTKEKENGGTGNGKPRSNNPLGGASAFSWMKSGAGPAQTGNK
ncbi:hypothetical protein NA57DRAFT_36859 [Rhizodiscina lignyota]|uniref:Ubiquitin carboxyl-terminal hydrolase 19 n=1 Tax=Rhizodiscina lignyota TaxID=1504668 RepID=A0A9P4IK28_9PEZI|nr:hypothetical protein NA57DRAFT_36859 [Rhizodiscina lignyota]